MISKPKYRRVLLKLSGESLMGNDNYGINAGSVDRVTKEIKAVISLGVDICLVIGA